MPRALSDTIIVAMIEAATRLAGGRGPISGSAPAPGATVVTRTEQGGPAGQETGASTTTAETAPAETRAPEPGAPPHPEHETRSAEQIGADFKTIYRHIEEVVRASAEQETKPVGFGLR
jgi:hypothetical protein